MVMRLCSHLKGKYNVTDDEDAEMSISDGHSWNGWLYIYDKAGKLIYSSFITGGIEEVVLHTIKCDEYNEEEKERAGKILQIIEEEWKEITS